MEPEKVEQEQRSFKRLCLRFPEIPKEVISKTLIEHSYDENTCVEELHNESDKYLYDADDDDDKNDPSRIIMHVISPVNPQQFVQNPLNRPRMPGQPHVTTPPSYYDDRNSYFHPNQSNQMETVNNPRYIEPAVNSGLVRTGVIPSSNNLISPHSPMNQGYIDSRFALQSSQQFPINASPMGVQADPNFARNIPVSTSSGHSLQGIPSHLPPPVSVANHGHHRTLSSPDMHHQPYIEQGLPGDNYRSQPVSTLYSGMSGGSNMPSRHTPVSSSNLRNYNPMLEQQNNSVYTNAISGASNFVGMPYYNELGVRPMLNHGQPMHPGMLPNNRMVSQGAVSATSIIGPPRYFSPTTAAPGMPGNRVLVPGSERTQQQPADYTETILRYQKSRRDNLRKELEKDTEKLEMLAKEVSSKEQELHDIYRSGDSSDPTQLDTENLQNENRRLQQEIDLMAQQLDYYKSNKQNLSGDLPGLRQTMGTPPVRPYAPPPYTGAGAFYPSPPPLQGYSRPNNGPRSSSVHYNANGETCLFETPKDSSLDSWILVNPTNQNNMSPQQTNMVMAMPITINPQPLLPPPYQPNNDDQEQNWSCTRCSFHNHGALMTCEICEHQRS